MGVRGTLLLKALDLGINMRARQLNKLFNDLGIVPLSSEKLHEIRNRLNKSKFKSEEWFKNELKQSGIKIKYLQNFPILKKYFADFYFRKQKLIIEIDGSSHKGKEEYDKKRDTILMYAGYKVIRVQAFNYFDLNNAFNELKKNDFTKINTNNLIKSKHKKNKKITLNKIKTKSKFNNFMNVYYHNNKDQINDIHEKMKEISLKK